MARKEAERSNDISLEELLTELEKYKQEPMFNDTIDKAIIEARKIGVSYPNIAKVLESKYGRKFNHNTIAKRYSTILKDR